MSVPFLRLFLIFSFLFFPARKVYSSAGRVAAPKTIWDEIMEGQSAMNMARGLRHMKREEYFAASKEFLKSVLRTPGNPAAHTLYGASLYWLGDIKGALREYEKAVSLDPDNAVAFQLKGIALAWEGRLDSALSSFLVAEKMSPGRGDVKMNIGSVYHSMGMLSDAMYYFRKALKTDPKNSLYNFQLGLLYKRLGRYDDALKSFGRALKTDPYYEDAIFQSAVVSEKTGGKGKAASLYRKCLRIKPFDGAARLKLAVLEAEKGNYAAMAETAEKIFMLTPGNGKGGISLSIMYSGNRSRDFSDDSQEVGGSPLGSIMKNLFRLPREKRAKIMVNFITAENPAPEKTARPGKALSESLKNRFSLPRLVYKSRVFYLDPSDYGKRDSAIRKIMRELEKISSSQKGVFNLAVNMETYGTAEDARGRGAKASVYYNPRNVGNDKGLWIIGHNWIEDIEDAAEELAESSALPETEKRLLLSCALTILGRFAEARESAVYAENRYPLLYNVLMTVVSVGEGDEKAALSFARKAAAADPGSETAAKNLKWLESGIAGGLAEKADTAGRGSGGE